MSKIYDVINKPMRAAIVAALVLYLALPVSDFQKPEKAEAIAPAAVAAVQVFGTVLAAAGIYVAGTTTAQYDANLNSIYNEFQNASSSWDMAWSQYVQDQGSFDQAMQTAVVDGEISLATFENTGLFESLGSYTAYCVDSGTMTVGDDSLDALVEATMLDGVQIPSMPFDLSYFNGDEYMVGKFNEKIASYPYIVGVIYLDRPNGTTRRGVLLSAENPAIVTLTDTSLEFGRGYRLYADFRADGKRSTSDANAGITSYPVLLDGTGSVYLNPSANVATSSGEVVQSAQVVGDSVATVTPDGNALEQSLYNDLVQVFEPTLEQLEAGFTSADVVAANTGEIAETTGDIATNVDSILTAITTSIGGLLNDIKTGVNAIPNSITAGVAAGVSGLGTVLNDIKTGVNGLESVIGSAVSAGASTVVTGVGNAVGALGDVLGDISTTLDNVWGGAQGWWADVLAWLGATPLAQLIAQIIAAINAGVLTLDAAIAAVQEWIGTAVLDIVGAIEAVQIPTFPEFEFPPFFDLDENPGNVDGSASVSQFNQTLHDKAPFAYMFAFSEGFSSVSGYSDSPHFRVRHTFELFDWEIPVDINAEPYLLYDLGGTTPAYLLRMSFSLALCMGVLYASYRLGLRAMSGGGE